MILKEVYSFIKNKYKLADPDVRALIEFKLQKNFSKILISEETLGEATLQVLEEEAYNLQQGYPLSYILNEQDFYKYKFYVDSNVLIPRTETEFLVDKIITDLHKNKQTPQLMMDIGAGSGCIGICLLLEFPDSKILFIEDSPGAVAVTLRNLRNHKISEDRYTICSSLLEAQDVLKEESLDLIVSNPPYIPKGDPRVDSSVKAYEPPHALYADDEGFAYLKEWSVWAMNHIKPDGHIYFEFGLGQEQELKKFSQSQNWECHVLKDQFDVDRFWFLRGMKNG